MTPDIVKIHAPRPIAADDASMSSSSSQPLPFQHVATIAVIEELNRLEGVIRQQYQLTLKDSEISPLYRWDDVAIDSVLGEGAFSFVFQVRIDEQLHALKCLKAKAIQNTDDLLCNALDLHNEAQILARVNHPHIIQITGLSHGTLGDSVRCADGYFLLLEIMETTLSEKLTQWRSEMESKKIRRKQLRSRDEVERRLLDMALPVATAMEYLHSHHIVLRDLKPENIGFDVRGQVKLFDFGLARLVQTVLPDDIAGSLCYMAPEILLGHGTQLASDVYSLTIVLWELCTIELPMARFDTMEQVKQRVAKGKWRPSVSHIPSGELRQQIRKGWSSNPSDRPTAHQMIQTLWKVCGMEDQDSDVNDSIHTHSSAQSLPLAMVDGCKQQRPRRAMSFRSAGSTRSLFQKKWTCS